MDFNDRFHRWNYETARLRSVPYAAPPPPLLVFEPSHIPIYSKNRLPAVYFAIYTEREGFEPSHHLRSLTP